MANSSSNQSCLFLEAQTQHKVLYVNIGVALFIWTILSLTQCRFDRNSKIWKWSPGLARPINAIHTSPYRLVYILAFSAISGDIISLILDPQLLFDYGIVYKGNTTAIATILKTMLTITDTVVTISVDSIVYLPLFACIDAPVPIVGYALGIISIPLLVWRQVLVVGTKCAQSSFDYWLQLAQQLPNMLCLCAQFLWFCWRIIKTLLKLTRAGHSIRATLVEHETTTYHVNRVKSLLKRPSTIRNPTIRNPTIRNPTIRNRRSKVKNAIFSFIYPRDTGVHLPLRFLAALMVMMYATYWLALSFLYYTISFTVELGVFLRGNDSYVLRAREVGFIGDFVLGLVYTAEVVLPAGPIIAFVWNLVIMVFMVRKVREHFQRVARGDLSFIAFIPSPSFRLLNSMKYTSYQIAYYVWSWFLIWIIVSLVGVAGYVIYFFTTNYQEQILLSVATVIIPIVYSLFVNWGQLLFVRLCFVGDTNNRNTVIKNLNLFHVFSYFLFFHNIIIGLASSLLRIISSVFFGLLIFFRLDRVVLMKGFERFDAGHSTYVSFLYVEHTQNNSVVHVFVDIIQAAVRGRRTAHSSDYLHVSAESDCLLPNDAHQEPSAGRWRRRWQVMYTMIRNPGVRPVKASREEALEDVIVSAQGNIQTAAGRELFSLPS